MTEHGPTLNPSTPPPSTPPPTTRPAPTPDFPRAHPPAGHRDTQKPLTTHAGDLERVARVFVDKAAELTASLRAYEKSIKGLTGAFGDDHKGQELAEKFHGIDEKIESFVTAFSRELESANLNLHKMAANVDLANAASIVAAWRALPELAPIPKKDL